jgi:hypothetical protein
MGASYALLLLISGVTILQIPVPSISMPLHRRACYSTYGQTAHALTRTLQTGLVLDFETSLKSWNREVAQKGIVDLPKGIACRGALTEAYISPWLKRSKPHPRITNWTMHWPLSPPRTNDPTASRETGPCPQKWTNGFNSGLGRSFGSPLCS